MDVSVGARRRNLTLIVGLVLSTLVVPIGQQVASASPPAFAKAFSPSTIGPGSTSTLTFTVANNDPVAAVDLAFTDNLPAAVTVAAPANLTNTCEGSVSAVEGSGLVSLSSGRVAASGSCSISVDVTAATPGTHTNTTGDLTSSNGNSGPATADLTVATDRPGFSKAFSPSVVDLGERSTLTFTIDNTANTVASPTLGFTDTLPVGMVVADPSGATTDCGSPPVAPTLTAVAGTNTVSLSYFGISGVPGVAAGASCAVTVDVVATAGGALGNSSGELTSVNVVSSSSGKANAVLTSNVSALHLTKEFSDDPLAPGAVGTLEFTIGNFARSDAAVDVAFADDLAATLSGLVAVAPLPTDPCGAGSTLSGTDTLSLTGGSIEPGASCTFSVSVAVPAAPGGAYVNTTTAVSGTVGGTTIVGNEASDTLFVVEAPTLTKEFTDDPVGPGGSVTLRFDITDNTLAGGSTDIAFSDELTTFLPFPIDATLPADGFCGAGSTLSFTSPGTDRQSLTMTGGSLDSAATCSFDVVIGIPAGFPGNLYTTTTGPVTATVGGESVTGGTASADLVVVAAPKLTKEFTDDPVAPGDMTTLQFTITNGGAGDDTNAAALGTATDITFTDDLAAVAPGITAVGLPLADVCGVGSSLTGSAGDTLLTLTGGELAQLTSCTFTVAIQTSATTPQGVHTNTTSALTATALGSTVTSPAPSDNLIVADIALTKEFTDDPVAPGDAVTLEFTIDNASPTENATGIFFTDDLDGALDNLAVVAGQLPLNDVCGVGSSLLASAGGTFLTFAGGSVPAGTSCTFSVVLEVPDVAATGTYRNTTSLVSMTIGGDVVELPAAVGRLVVADEDTEVEAKADLSITKTDSVDPVVAGESLTYTVTVANAGPSDAVGVVVTDVLPVGVTFVSSSGCAEDPAGAPTCTLGDVAAGESESYTLTVDVDAATVGTITNSASVTATTLDPDTSNNSITEDTQVDPPPFGADLSITKADDVDPVRAHSSERLIYTITVTNFGPFDAEDVVVTDVLPSGIQFKETQGCLEHKNFGVPNCTLGDIAAGTSASYTIEVKMKTQTPLGILTNTATVSSSTIDPDLSNNSTTEDTLVCARVTNGVCAGSGSLVLSAGSSSPATQTGIPITPVGGLPVTGSDGFNSLMTVGLGALALGLGLLGTSRRRRQTL